MGTAKAIQLYLAEGSLNGILTIQEPAGWGAGILVSAPRENFDKLLQRPEVDNAGIYFLLSESQVYIGQSQSSIKNRLSQHDRKKDWWNRVIFLTKTDKSLRATDVQYMEVEFIKLADKAGTSDMDNKSRGNQNSYISEFDRAANDQFMNEALLLLEVIGITVFSIKNEKKKEKLIKPNNKEIIKKEIKTEYEYRKWNFEISNIVFYYKTKNGGYASLKWSGENEFVLLEGSKLGNITRDNANGDKAKKLREEHSNKIKNFRLIEDIVFDKINPTSQIVIGGAANAWVSWKNDDGKTLDEVIKELNLTKR